MYNPAAAIAYAHRWAKGRNPRYYDFDKIGGDCTNFISQCLFAGGFSMNYAGDGGWFYNNINSRSPSWSGVEELRDFIVGNRGVGPRGYEADVYETRPGDIIQLHFGGSRFEHSLFVVGSNGGDPLICCHTYDSDNRSLSSYAYVKARGLIVTAESYL
jgi:hypothetical protein